MQFNEKLIYLMNITNTSNKMLAGAINVDPSMISLIRTGRRGQPRNEDHIRSMAEYFASKCTTAYQRDAIAEIAGSAENERGIHIPLSDILFEWLSGKLYAVPGNMENVLKEFNKPLPTPPIRQKINLSDAAIAPMVFFGNQGKCEAFRAIYASFLKVEEPGTIYAYTDESSPWFQTEPQLFHEMQQWKMTLIDRGFRFIHILPPAASPQFFETIVHWIPLYLTGQIQAYYYPRLRDNMFRRSLLLLKDQVALCCDSIATEYDTPLSVLSFNPLYIDAQIKMFQDMTKICQRTMVAHTQSTEILDSFIRYMQISSDYVQCSQELPIHLLPNCYLRELLDSSTEDFRNYFMDYFIPGSTLHQNIINSCNAINIAPIYGLDDILSGKVTFMFPGHTKRYPYTPAIYRDHLNAVITFMENHPNYTLIPVSPQDIFVNIMIKKDRSSLIIRQTDPIAVFEIEQPEIIAPFYEFLMNMVERHPRQSYSRKKIIAHMREVSEEFTRYLDKQNCTCACAERNHS